MGCYLLGEVLGFLWTVQLLIFKGKGWTIRWPKHGPRRLGRCASSPRSLSRRQCKCSWMVTPHPRSRSGWGSRDQMFSGGGFPLSGRGIFSSHSSASSRGVGGSPALACEPSIRATVISRRSRIENFIGLVHFAVGRGYGNWCNLWPLVASHA